MDISANPISGVGAQAILTALSEFNDTLGDLGDLEETTFMGVRVREELHQAIKLNNLSHDKKKAFLAEKMAHNRVTNVDETAALADAKDELTAKVTSAKSDYPLLKPITFTNIVTDDYLESGVWHLR